MEAYPTLASYFRQRMQLYGFLGFLLVCLRLGCCAQPSPTRLWTTAELLHEVRKAHSVGSVLYVAAHPDDENTALIAYLAQVRHLRTGYLSLTRGEGGQNLIGAELGDDLGLIRTQELLAARNRDGGIQFFTCARDFGFSKTPEESYRFWNRDSVLADMVWIIRTFRPDVVITRFTPDTGYIETHGHHTASAQLALEAVRLAADPTQYPEQLTYPEASCWQPLRILWNGYRNFGTPKKQPPAFQAVEIGTFLPLLGQDAGEIAAESRSMHKSQGFGSQRTRGPRTELFASLWGDTAQLTDPFHIPEDSVSAAAMHRVRSHLLAAEPFLIADRVKATEALATAYRVAADIPNPHLRHQKQEQLTALVRQAAGLWWEATVPKSTYVPYESISVTFETLLRTDSPIELVQWRVIGTDGQPMYSTLSPYRLQPIPRNLARDTVTFSVLGDLPYSTPFWLRSPGTDGRLGTRGQRWVGRPSPEPLLRAACIFRIGETTLADTLPVVYKYRSATDGDVYQPVELLPPVCINPSVDALVFADERPQLLPITITGIADSLEGTVELELPPGWRFEWVTPPVLPGRGLETTAQARIYPGTTSGEARVVVSLSDSNRYGLSLSRIRYDHIPQQTRLKPATVRLIRTEVVCQAKRIGYVPGAGDEVAESLQAMGLTVDVLDDATISGGDLSVYDAILVGIRAYNAQPRIGAWHPRLRAYAEAGGTLILQYCTTTGFQGGTPRQWDFGFSLSRERVTNESASVRWSPHPILTQPNLLGAADFTGWVQERGLYFLSEWPAHYDAPLVMADPGEPELRGGLVLGPLGRGTVIYSGLSFFRQLPAGVPGAYRLLANMLSYRATAK